MFAVPRFLEWKNEMQEIQAAECEKFLSLCMSVEVRFVIFARCDFVSAKRCLPAPMSQYRLPISFQRLHSLHFIKYYHLVPAMKKCMECNSEYSSDAEECRKSGWRRTRLPRSLRDSPDRWQDGYSPRRRNPRYSCSNGRVSGTIEIEDH